MWEAIKIRCKWLLKFAELESAISFRRPINIFRWNPIFFFHFFNSCLGRSKSCYYRISPWDGSRKHLTQSKPGRLLKAFVFLVKANLRHCFLKPTFMKKRLLD